MLRRFHHAVAAAAGKRVALVIGNGPTPTPRADNRERCHDSPRPAQLGFEVFEGIKLDKTAMDRTSAISPKA